MSIFGSSHFGLPRLKPLSSKRAHVVSVLDIGSTKVVCMIGRLTPRAESELLPGRTHNVEVIGIGHQKSRGVKNRCHHRSRQAAEQRRAPGRRCRRAHGRPHHREPHRQRFLPAACKAMSIPRPSISVARKSMRTTCARCWPLPAAAVAAPGPRDPPFAADGFSLDGERGIRDPLSHVRRRARRRHACADGERRRCEPRTLHQPLRISPSRHGGDALCQRPLGARRR
jgi:cell division protein FtsA